MDNIFATATERKGTATGSRVVGLHLASSCELEAITGIMLNIMNFAQASH